MRLGVIDVGSNTVHLLVVDAHYGAAPVPAYSEKVGLRLAERLTDGEHLDRAAVAELCAFLQRAVVVAEDMGVTELMAFATSALRDAADRAEVVEQVRGITGVDLQVLSGADEARLTFLAVRRWYGWSADRLLVLDIGGGSLEIANGVDEEPDVALSLPLGAGRLTRRLSADPPDLAELRSLRREVRAAVADNVGRVLRAGQPRSVVATSKTFRQLARIAGAAPSGEGVFVRRSLTRTDLAAWVERLAGLDAASRARLPGVSAERAGQLLAGAVVAHAAMDLLQVETVDICPWALREGVILRRLDGLEP